MLESKLATKSVWGKIYMGVHLPPLHTGLADLKWGVGKSLITRMANIISFCWEDIFNHLFFGGEAYENEWGGRWRYIAKGTLMPWGRGKKVSEPDLKLPMFPKMCWSSSYPDLQRRLFEPCWDPQLPSGLSFSCRVEEKTLNLPQTERIKRNTTKWPDLRRRQHPQSHQIQPPSKVQPGHPASATFNGLAQGALFVARGSAIL